MWSDRLYLKLLFRLSGGDYTLNLEQPRTFNEKLNWNKLNDHNPLYHTLVDKYEVKNFVSSAIGEEYVVPCYGVWDSIDDIDFEKLPSSFVLKATHDSSGAFICKDKRHIDFKELKKHFKDFLSGNYWAAREWVYKDLKPRVIADKLLDDNSGRELTDYKFWCFNGIPRLMYITNKGNHVEENFYDMDFKPVQIDHGFQRTVPEYQKPKEFEVMKELCVKLLGEMGGAKPSFVRIDFFDVEGHVYFGEFTFYDWGGYMPFANYQMDLRLGKMFEK